LLLSGESQALAMAVDWPAYARANGPVPPLLRDLVPAGEGNGAAHNGTAPDVEAEPPILTELKSLATRERLRCLRAHVTRLVAAELELPPQDVDPRHELSSLGFDSMMNMELNAGLERGLGVVLGLTLTFDHPTVEAITRHLLDDVLRLEAAADEPRVRPGSTQGEGNGAVSDVDIALLEELASLKQVRP
ncbi:MAG: acyl carrier protein, partial [Pseudomonadota bacterium]